MKKFIGLRKKILLSMIFLLLLQGLTAAFINQVFLFRLLKTEFQNKGLIHARSIAAYSLVDILTQNSSRLKKMLDYEKRLDANTAYIFITNSSGRVLAHTFPKGFPVDLIKANMLPKNKDFNIQLLDTQLGFIYDINIPILLDKSLIGNARLGILQSGIQRTIILIDSVIIVVTFLLIIIGLILAYKISSLITQPISKLIEATESIRKGNFSTKIEIRTKDEIGLLAGAFNKMTAYLSQLVEEVGRLTRQRERESIALDLHDTCAQDLANLIKRLELCEKLFKIEPLKAFEELNALKENIRGHLFKARQVIHGLKSPEEEGFPLSQKINEFIRNYQQHDKINLKFNVSGPVNKNIPANKATHIFYIITEALTNIRKHAQAKNVDLSLDYNGINELIIKIKDDGIGFDPQKAGLLASASGKWGLMGMRQRAASLGGALVISSMPKQGTEILVRIPFSGIIYNI
ncbi:MAG: HAMP domain-containing protein [Candidatus Omnitrophota bacterium]|nr:HAMP domain-containing protein [Candidatus Omnitrophota bacterium]